jgi:hypothetical protein
VPLPTTGTLDSCCENARAMPALSSRSVVGAGFDGVETVVRLRMNTTTAQSTATVNEMARLISLPGNPRCHSERAPR